MKLLVIGHEKQVIIGCPYRLKNPYQCIPKINLIVHWCYQHFWWHGFSHKIIKNNLTVIMILNSVSSCLLRSVQVVISKYFFLFIVAKSIFYVLPIYDLCFHWLQRKYELEHICLDHTFYWNHRLTTGCFKLAAKILLNTVFLFSLHVNIVFL